MRERDGGSRRTVRSLTWRKTALASGLRGFRSRRP
nr:MAG TPA: hypothetical protein [Caudoviricetes sp.]